MSNATKMITNTCKIWLPFTGAGEWLFYGSLAIGLVATVTYLVVVTRRDREAAITESSAEEAEYNRRRSQA